MTIKYLINLFWRGVRTEVRLFSKSIRQHTILGPIDYLSNLPLRRKDLILEILRIPSKPLLLRIEEQRFKNSHRPLHWSSLLPEATSAEEVSAHFSQRSAPYFLPGPNLTNHCTLMPDTDEIISEGNSILDGHISVLGTGIDTSSENMWHSDPKSGKVWPMHYYKRLLPVANTVDNTDVKIPWELSRLNHLLTLGIAYRISEDERYAERLGQHLDDWWKNNPYKIGVNWTLTMDVAMRSSNMILAFYLSRGSRIWTSRRIIRLVTSLQEHSEYIIENLENQGVTSNHYLSNLAGLLYITEMFPELPYSSKWNSFARKELEIEIVKQTNPDGSNVESSISYHRLVLEMFFSCAVLCRANGKPLTNLYDTQLRGMFEFVCGYLKPCGTAPLIGDNDSARWHRLFHKDDRDHSYLTNLGSLYFDDPILISPESEFGIEDWVFFGNEGVERFKSLKARSKNNSKSEAFSDFGLYIARDNSNYLCVSCGPNSHLEEASGGHAHNDKLSFELMLRGIDIVLDPGVFTYTRSKAERTYFRGTRSHNTITIDGEEQNRIFGYLPFVMEDISKAKGNSAHEPQGDWVFTGEHHGYTRLKPGVVHRRTFRFRVESGNLAITDELIPKNEHSNIPHEFTWRFHLAEGTETRITGQTVHIFRQGLTVCIEISGTTKLRWNVTDGWLAPSYGVRVPAPVLQTSGRLRLPVTLETRWWVKNQ